MKIENLATHFATEEEGNSFVGLKIIGNQINVFFPESYHFDSDNYEREDFLDLLKTIPIAKKNSLDIAGTFDSRQNQTNSSILSYIWMIEDYCKNGFYVDSKRVLKENHNGRINWKKTIQLQPIVSGRNIIYPTLLSEYRSPRYSILVEAHRYCVKKSLTLIGWLYGLTPSIIETAPGAEKMIPRYLDAVKAELNQTYDDQKYIRLIHMENVLLGLDESVTNAEVVYGVDSYHHVFEKMVDCIFGNENAKEYYPKFTWHLKYSEGTNGLAGPTIRPDTILKYGPDEDIYIIDSKYYRYGSLNLSQTKGLPESASIVKQITYGSYVQSKYPNKRIYNVFVLPYDAKSQSAEMVKEQDKDLIYVGKVTSDWEGDKTYGNIYTILIDLRHVVKVWNRIAHDSERGLLVRKVKENLSAQ